MIDLNQKTCKLKRSPYTSPLLPMKFLILNKLKVDVLTVCKSNNNSNTSFCIYIVIGIK